MGTSIKTKNDLESSNDKVREILEQLQIAESELQQSQRSIEEINFEIRTIARDTRNHASSIEQREKNLNEQTLELTEMENTKVELEKELKTPFQSQLSNEEKNEL